MIGNRPPPFPRLFCTALLAPQAVAIPVRRLRASFAAQGRIPAPFPPMVPLLYSSDPPPPPVPGLLPVCQHPLSLGLSLESAVDSRWVIWPVDSGPWFLELQKSLSEESNLRFPDGLFPLGQGIPLAWSQVHGFADYGLTDQLAAHGQVPRWRALSLVCYAFTFRPERSWYLSVYWRELWKRRLRRAPAISNKLD